jgi:ATP-dependent helicase/DNAse subunit B
MSKKLKVSFSALDTYKTCPRKYYYNYILKLPKFDKPWFVFGNFNHTILEKFFKIIIRCKQKNLEYDKKELMYKSYTSALKKYQNLANQGKKLRLTPAQLKETKGIIKKFFDRDDGELPDVMYVEKEFTIDLTDSIVLRGYIDRIDDLGNDTYRIVDYKTSKKSYKIDKNNQLDLYAIGFKKYHPDAKQIFKQLDFIKLNKRTDPKHTHDLDREEEVIADVTRQSIEIQNKIVADEKNLTAWEPKENDFCWACDFKDQCDQDRGISFL